MTFYIIEETTTSHEEHISFWETFLLKTITQNVKEVTPDIEQYKNHTKWLMDHINSPEKECDDEMTYIRIPLDEGYEIKILFEIGSNKAHPKIAALIGIFQKTKSDKHLDKGLRLYQKSVSMKLENAFYRPPSLSNHHKLNFSKYINYLIQGLPHAHS
jgi:hypothetical protein